MSALHLPSSRYHSTFPSIQKLGFARRYFVLHESGILAYSIEPGRPFRDQILIPQAAISTARGRKDIHIDSNAATFHIKCLTGEDFNKWMTALRFVPPTRLKMRITKVIDGIICAEVSLLAISARHKV